MSNATRTFAIVQSPSSGVYSCRRKTCAREPVKRGLCRDHYLDQIRVEAARRAEIKRDEETRIANRSRRDPNVPARGLGILRCFVCFRPLARHRITETCLAGVMDRI